MFRAKLITFSIALILAGCASRQEVTELNTTARADATSIQTQAKAAFAEANAKSENDVSIEGVNFPILGGRAIPRERKLPEVFSNSYFFNGIDEERLIDVVKQIAADTGIMITARDDVYNPTASSIQSQNNGDLNTASANLVNTVRTESNLDVASRVRLPTGTRYDGTVGGFFDYLASVLNITWTYLHDEDRVLLTRYVERSYPLFVPPSQQIEGAGADQSDVWKDTESSIEGLLSEGGSVSVNQLAGTISVVDTSDVQKMVAGYLNKVNRRLSKGVNFQLQILSVALSDREAKGFNFDFVHTGNNSVVNLNGGGLSIPSSVGLTASIASGPFNGSKIIQQNLSEKGEVTIARNHTIRAMNNQLVNFQQVQTVPVVTEFTPSVIDSNGNVTPAGASLTDIEVGFKADLVPAIMDDGQHMVVRVGLETSNINEIRDIQLSDDGQFLQSARVTSRKYNQTFSMKNSDTLVISGFYDRTNEFKEKKSSWWITDLLFRSIEDEAERRYYVVLLTPVIHNGGAF